LKLNWGYVVVARANWKSGESASIKKQEMWQPVCYVRLQRPPWLWWELRTSRRRTLKPARARCSRIEINSVMQLPDLCLSVSSTENFSEGLGDW